MTAVTRCKDDFSQRHSSAAPKSHSADDFIAAVSTQDGEKERRGGGEDPEQTSSQLKHKMRPRPSLYFSSLIEEDLDYSFSSV